MQAAECDECSLTAVMIGDAVRAKCRCDVDLDNDEVGRIVEVEFLDVLVYESDVVIRIEICGESGQPERREGEYLMGRNSGLVASVRAGRTSFTFMAIEIHEVLYIVKYS